MIRPQTHRGEKPTTVDGTGSYRGENYASPRTHRGEMPRNITGSMASFGTT
jgi:hypothetical protein